MVTVSCSGKLHAFALAEQLEKNNILDSFYTTYAWQKNTFLRKFVKRIDKEKIPADKIHTNSVLAFPVKLMQSRVHIWNNLFDKWVASKLSGSNSKVFIGWSGMSLHSMRSAKKNGMKTIVERGSTHICFQDEILREEYKKFGKEFSVHPAVIKKELAEYEEADYISVPSFFVKKTFLEKGIPERKILLNPYGASEFFKSVSGIGKDSNKKFTIVYLGTLSIRKGLIYLMQALQQLAIPGDQYEVWFIGNVDDELKPAIEKLKKDNWKFFGHIAHYELPEYLSQCDIAVQPSLEEGLSMVIPQLMACGVPVIVTPNSGGENVIQDGINGYVIPARNPQAISNCLEELINNKDKLELTKSAALKSIEQGYTWNNYGNRYAENLIKIVSGNI